MEWEGSRSSEGFAGGRASGVGGAETSGTKLVMAPTIMDNNGSSAVRQTRRKGGGGGGTCGRRRVLHLHDFFLEAPGNCRDVGAAADRRLALKERHESSAGVAADNRLALKERLESSAAAGPSGAAPDRRLAPRERYESSGGLVTRRERGTAMDSALWSTLPDHILDSILARLPIQSFFRFRTVCKTWNKHMYSNSFLEAYAGTPPQGPWFFFFTHDERNHVSAYNYTVNKWHRLPLCPPHSNTNPFSAADGGLVCYFSYENGCKSIVVCNPLTKSCHRLPPLLKAPSKVTMLAMVVDRATRAYKVVVAGVAGSDYGVVQNRAEVYDSRTESWAATGGNCPASHTLSGKPVVSQGFLYVRSQTKLRNLLLAYDLDQGVWSDLQTPLPSTVRHGELLEWQGRILMVGELEEHHKVQSICIWEQTAGGLKWKEVDRLPADLFESFFGDKDYFQCNERDDVILDWCQAGRFVLLFTYNHFDMRGRCKLLVYDLAKRSWQKLQNFSRADVCGTGRTIRGIFYEPRLDARA